MSGLQINAAVSSDAGGNFVVVWANYIDPDTYDVFGRRFNAAGVPQATTFQVNIYTTYAQRYPAVAVDADGDFVVAWSSPSQDGGGSGIFARRFNSSGTGGPEFQVNSYTLTGQYNPSVGLEDNGDFVIVWQGDFQDGSEGAIFGQRYNALGLLLGVEFQINSYTALFQDSPRLDMDADGDLVVVWRSTPQDGDSGGVFAQRFNSLGAKLGVELQVNAFFSGEQGRPAVALRDAGDFVVAWQSLAQDGSGYGVFGRHVSASGALLGVEFQLGTFTASGQSRPRIDFKAGGDFVVTWSSNSQDGSSTGIFAQRFRIPVPLDVDGNGTTDPLSDGLLVLRYEFGFRGATLITAAVGAGCTRCTAPEIEAYLAGMV